MKSKLLLVVLILTFIFSTCFFVSAQTFPDTQRQALIAQIQQQINQLQQQLSQMLAQQGSALWCFTFNSNIGYASHNVSDINNLHVALQKGGISYGSDDINTYGTGTSEAVAQFQTKYGISPQSGYVGVKTRAKLNQLYGCGTNTPPVIVCSPSWQCSDWSLCVNGQQTKTCTDSNSCGVNTNEPKLFQTCTQQSAVKIQANGSDGPLNIFLTLGNGASINGSQIALIQNLNLQWTGVDVSSCVVSDSLKPSIFSGYEPSSGSQSVTLSGNIQNISNNNNNNKVSDTFKITCVSVKSGSSVSDSVVVNLFYTVNGNCYPNWQCNQWTTCANSKQTRTCTDLNGCGSSVGEPLETQSCTLPPIVNITANSYSNSTTITSGKSASLAWTSFNVTSCSASGDWSGSLSINGTKTISAITSTKTYNITCTGIYGSATSSVTVNIADNQ